MTPPVDDFPCNLFVEVVTDYLDGAMAPEEAGRFEEHLAICDGCAGVLEQFRVILRLTGRLGAGDIDQLPPSQRGPILQAFRNWHVPTES
jgi:predicted anti-sigma-YlaC factor YlaD